MSKPVYLFAFTQGDDVVCRRAASARDVTAMGETWVASSISIDDLPLTGDADKDSVKFQLPITDDWVSDYVRYRPDDTVTIAIYRYERGEDTSELAWQGQITYPDVDGGIVTFNCDPETSMSGTVTLGRVVMRQCPHSIFTGECRLDRANFLIPITLVSVSGVTVTFEPTSLVSSGSLAGGMIEAPDGSLRGIVSNTESIITLEWKMRPLLAAFDLSEPIVNVSPGCSQAPERCASFANADNPSGTNIENYGGFLWMLTGDKNPFGGSSAT